MPLSPQAARDLTVKQLLPKLREDQERLDRIDRWARWSHDDAHRPKHSSPEYRELISRAQTPWLGLVVTAVAQALYVEGYRGADGNDAAPWKVWQANGMDARQIAVHRAALTYGLAYVTVLPGTDPITREPMPVLRGVSPRRMVAFYADPADDEFPYVALRADPMLVNGTSGWRLRLYDDTNIHWMTADTTGGDVQHVRSEAHDLGVCPVVRYANQIDLEGRADGEVEPFIPAAARIDQTVFDRLVVQRFASWKVRTIAGMTKPPELAGDLTDAERAAALEAAKLRLSVDNILVAEDHDTKFGVLDETPLDGFIKGHDADVRDLAAVTQTPPHHLLGQMANLSAEALAAAEASLSRKVEERKHSLGESHEQTLRLSAHAMGDETAARDTTAQVRWRDMESRSLAQVADALGKIATMLKVPVQALWPRIPGWTQQDVENAKQLVTDGDATAQLLALVDRTLTTAEQGGGDT
jgi:hypothetical protein